MPFLDDARERTKAIRERVLAHPFVGGLGDGTLVPDRFRGYLIQDYLFLIRYARVLGLAVAKAPELAVMARFGSLLDATLNVEMDLHRSICTRFGVPPAELETAEPTGACRTYTDHLLSTAWSGTLGEICAALVPCQHGYAEIASVLAAISPAGNPYQEWIDAYTSSEYTELAAWLCALTDRLADRAGDDERERMLDAYITSADHELAFWEMAWGA
jgi:thiaminase (transcriptional activator TenA)